MKKTWEQEQLETARINIQASIELLSPVNVFPGGEEERNEILSFLKLSVKLIQRGEFILKERFRIGLTKNESDD